MQKLNYLRTKCFKNCKKNLNRWRSNIENKSDLLFMGHRVWRAFSLFMIRGHVWVSYNSLNQNSERDGVHTSTRQYCSELLLVTVYILRTLGCMWRVCNNYNVFHLFGRAALPQLSNCVWTLASQSQDEHQSRALMPPTARLLHNYAAISLLSRQQISTVIACCKRLWVNKQTQ